MKEYVESYRFWKSPVQIVELVVLFTLIIGGFNFIASGFSVSKTLTSIEIVIGGIIGLCLLLSIPKMKVRVTDNYIGIKIFPIHFSEQKIKYNNITSLVVEHPLLGFGAGALLNPKSKYFRLRGESESVLLSRRNGDRLILIGSPDAEHLAREIRKRMQETTENAAKEHTSIFNKNQK